MVCSPPDKEDYSRDCSTMAVTDPQSTGAPPQPTYNVQIQPGAFAITFAAGAFQGCHFYFGAPPAAATAGQHAHPPLADRGGPGVSSAGDQVEGVLASFTSAKTDEANDTHPHPLTQRSPNSRRATRNARPRPRQPPSYNPKQRIPTPSTSDSRVPGGR